MIGMQGETAEPTSLLCLKGGDNGPRKFMRFSRTDEPERVLTYMAEDEQVDAIQFIPKKDISIVGFSVYPAIVPFQQQHLYLDDVKVMWKIKIDGVVKVSKETIFSNCDIQNKIVDIMMDEEMQVRAQ